MKSNKNGFSIIEVLVIIVVIALLGAAGWLMYDRQKNQTDNNISSPSTTVNTNNQSTSENPSSENVKNEYVTIKDWGVKVSQPENESIVASDPLGDDVTTGALGTVHIYAPKYDKNYTCDSSQGETHKAKIVTIQKFSNDSNIESNTKNKPDVVKTVGSFKYGVYKPVSDCYDSSTSSTIQSLIQSYLENITIVSN